MCLPLFDLVPLTCRVQCSGLGMRISLEDKEFIQSIDHLLFSPVTVTEWVRPCSGWLPPFDRARPRRLLARHSLASCSCLVFSSAGFSLSSVWTSPLPPQSIPSLLFTLPFSHAKASLSFLSAALSKS